MVEIQTREVRFGTTSAFVFERVHPLFRRFSELTNSLKICRAPVLSRPLHLRRFIRFEIGVGPFSLHS